MTNGPTLAEIRENGTFMTAAVDGETDADRNARLLQEHTAVMQGIRQAEAAMRQAGQPVPGESIGILNFGINALMGQGDAESMGAFVNANYTAGREMMENGRGYQIVDGEWALPTALLSLFTGDENTPLQIPREAFNSVRNLAIEQIVSNPEMLVNIDTGDAETNATLAALAGEILTLDSQQDRQAFIDSFTAMLDDREGANQIILGDRAWELTPEATRAIRQEMEDIIGATMLGYSQNMNIDLGLSGFWETLMGWLGTLAEVGTEFAQGMGINVDFTDFVPNQFA